MEEKQLRSVEKIETLLSLYFIVGWRIMYAMMLGRCCGDVECTAIFEDEEWMPVWKIVNRGVSLPDKVPTLSWLMKEIAIFGGYLNRKGDKPPGVKVIWKGMQCLFHYAIAWEAFGQTLSSKSFG